MTEPKPKLKLTSLTMLAEPRLAQTERELRLNRSLTRAETKQIVHETRTELGSKTNQKPELRRARPETVTPSAAVASAAAGD
ncbi:hypothetical protein Hanom_Chr15g01343341 [Helianthus anomalus]